MADEPVRRTVLQGGRAKAFRPLPESERRTALEAALAAYGRGDFFEAHELLEPAWMGTDDPAERELLQGLIKLAAAYVHSVRGNPLGMRKNLAGARDRLAAGAAAAPRAGVAIEPLLAAIDERLASGPEDASPVPSVHRPPPIRRSNQ